MPSAGSVADSADPRLLVHSLPLLHSLVREPRILVREPHPLRTPRVLTRGPRILIGQGVLADSRLPVGRLVVGPRRLRP